MRLLLYSPKTEFSKNRASSISGGGQSLADDIEGASGRFYDWKRELQSKYGDSASRFEVRVYRDNPSMSTFIIDDVALVGIYLKGGTGLTAPELIVHNKGAQASAFCQFEEHFEKVWEDAKPCEGG
ncbi:MAG: hypothetical protein K0U79_10990 [Gammaproteobacteria bacterium]|nr:hypothetical protein [Gammaproteobacteria bacterium]